MTWTFLTNAVDKSPTTTGAWVTIDLSANVPAGTKTALLKIVNTSSTAYAYGIRPVGSSVTRTANGNPTSSVMAIVKLDTSYQFQAYIANTAVKIYLWGYSDEDLCFTDPYDKSTGTTDSWVDVANSELPSGAKGAIYERVNTSKASSYVLALRPKGSTADHSSSSKLSKNSHEWAVIGVDASRYAQQYINNTASDLYLWGSAGSDFNSFTNPYDITPATTGAWVTVSLTSYIPAGASGVLLAFQNTGASAYDGDARKTGSTDNFVKQVINSGNKFLIVGVNSSRQVDLYIGNTAVKVYLWGYFSPAVTYTITLTDSIGLLDTAHKLSGKKQIDSISLLDTFTDQTLLYIVLAESIGLVDTAPVSPEYSHFDPTHFDSTHFYIWPIEIMLFDAIGLLDVYSKTWTVRKVVADSIGVADTVKKLASKTQSDKLGLLDTYVRVWSAHKVVADSIGLIDESQKGSSVLKADSIGLLDTSQKLAGKTQSDKIGLLDTSQKSSAVLKTGSIGLLDKSQKGSAVLKADSIGLLDVYSRTWTVYRTLTDSAGLLDTSQKLADKKQLDSIGLLDTYARVWSVYKVVADSIGVADTVKKLASKTQSDKLGLLDTLKKESSLVKADSIGLLDVYSRTWTMYKTVTDSVGIADAVQKLAGKTQSDSIALLDTFSKVWSAHRVIADSIELLDTTRKLAGKAQFDRVGLLDTVKKESLLVKADSIALLDTFSKVWSAHRVLAESIGLVDTAPVSPEYSHFDPTHFDSTHFYIWPIEIMLFDAIGLLDVYSKTWTVYRILADSMGLTDVTQKLAGKAQFDSIGLLDTTRKLAGKAQFDRVGLLDTVKKESLLVKADSIALLDTFSKVWSAHRVLAESIGLVDVTQKLAGKTQFDRLGLFDTIKKESSLVKADSIGLLDVYSRTWSMYKTVTDSIGIADAVQKATHIKRADSVGLLDTYSRVYNAYRTLADSIGLKDNIAPSVARLLELSEKIALVDKAYKLRVAKFRRTLRPSRVLGSVRELEREREEPGRVE